MDLGAGLPASFGLNADQAADFDRYLTLLVRWNARINLTAVRTPEEIVSRHFVECLFAARQIPANVKTLLDFGSGAGFPGIPVAIVRPEIAVTLAESQGKKAAFLREVVRTLGLKAEVWSGRVEALPAERVFDRVMLRAVDKMAEACGSAILRLSPEGRLMVFATRKTEPALDTLAEPNGLQWEPALPLPGSQQGILKLGHRLRKE
ncbi:MAG TPA: 16S rRNA (guanine(527)-N(7))-methyltransferase RsmG [Acidobacteriaceae bacterium]|jgi:16S rRNA (guanine527-N7)-methyltransferase|nr:16S rRNA (guanine(527)-N(7))-methyltransferase RsmG [Acidobacteriaceae bacterium]